MVKVASAEALIDAYGDDQDYLQLNDVVLGLEKTEDLLNSVLWSVRSDSPRLFFLTRSDLVSLLFECHNDLLQLYQYIPKIFPAVSSLILVEDTKLTIDKTGYHPEIQGIISLDGERIHFDEVMKVTNRILKINAQFSMQCYSGAPRRGPLGQVPGHQHASKSPLAAQAVFQLG